MDSELYDLIHNSKAVDPNEYSYVSYYGPQLKLHIKSHEQSLFWKKYCQLASSDLQEEKPNLGLCIGERPQGFMPVVCRATLRFQNDENFKRFEEDFILAVVYCYQQAIMEICQIDDDETYLQLRCCVLSTDEVIRTNSECICTFALQFPYCKTETILQTVAIRPRVIQLLRAGNVFSRLPQQPMNDWGDILDPMVTNEPWPLYRSTTNPSMFELGLTNIYEKIDQIHIENGEGPELDISEAYDPTRHPAVTDGLIPSSWFCDQIDYSLWIPLFLSIDYWNVKTMPHSNVATEVYKKTPTTSNITGFSMASSMGLDTKEETSFDIIDRLLPLLGRHRVETDHFWIDVGKALYTEALKAGNLESGLNLWTRFTQKGESHTEEDCQRLYPSFNIDNHLSIKTIALYSKQDSLEGYQAWHDAWCLPAFDRATSGEHTDVAEALYRMYWLDFVCANAEKKRWYHFSNHRWFPLDSGITLRKFISSEFRGKFEQMTTSLSHRRQTTTDEREKELLSVTLKKIEALIRKLKSVPFKGNLMKEALEKFHNSQFDKIVDSNPCLIGLLNGVVETSQSYACVRDGKPEDYVSKSCDIFWRSDFHWKHPTVVRTMKWLSEVFTDDKLLHYSLKLFASCLRGKNSDKLFPILTGEGDNSKSMIKKLFEVTFGSYCTTFPTTLLTSKRANSSAPSPEIAQAKNARLSFLQEPDSDDPFKNGTLKELTGGDSFFCRMLNDNGGKVEATFKLFLMCNKVPLIPGSDRAVKNRLRILPFLSTWVDNAPADENERKKLRMFQKDPFFESCIVSLAPAFMWILVEYFAMYISQGLQEPDIIKEHTAEYWRENDIYQQFVTENYKPAEVTRADGTKERDQAACVTFVEMFGCFKTWFKENFSSLRTPEKSSVKYELLQRLGKITKNGWVGLRPIQQLANADAFLIA